eukprot:TCONS_00016896-protein
MKSFHLKTYHLAILVIFQLLSREVSGSTTQIETKCKQKAKDLCQQETSSFLARKCWEIMFHQCYVDDPGTGSLQRDSCMVTQTPEFVCLDNGVCFIVIYESYVC